MQIIEYLDLLRRRRSWIILICLGVPVSAGGVAMRLPSVYRAETTILVNPEKGDDNLVSVTAGWGGSYRLSTVREQVMSPTQLGPLLDELKMYPELGGKVTTRELVRRIESATTIEFQDAGRQGS